MMIKMKKKERAMATLLLAFLLSLNVVASGPGQSYYGDISYGDNSDNVLDLWIAPGETPRPLLVFIHGGAWISGDKELVNTQVPIDDWLNKGVSVASINYRYSPLSNPVYDAARAVQFLRYHAAE